MEEEKCLFGVETKGKLIHFCGSKIENRHDFLWTNG